MNGSLFGTAKVITNFVNMVSCRKTKHGCCRQFGMLIFMFYTVTLFTFQFFIVGAMFASIYVFYNHIFSSVFDGRGGIIEYFGNGTMTTAFAYVYIFLLVLCLIMALALPLDRAKTCFMVTTVLFAVMTLSCIFGMVFYLANTGFFPEEMVFDKDTW